MARRLNAAAGLPAAVSRLTLVLPVILGAVLSGCATGPEAADETSSLSPMSPDTPKNAAAAREYWSSAYAKNPHDERAVIAFAHALKADGAKDKALGVLQQAAIYSPDSLPIAAEEGRLALDMGQADLAEKLLSRANDPTHPDWRVLNALGALQAQRDDRPGAQGYFERAAQLAPTDPGVLNNLALCYALGGDPARAESLLRKALNAGGDAVRIRQNLALVLGLQGKYDEAEELTARDLGKEKAEANRAYMQRMVASTPLVLGKHARAETRAIPGAWQTAVEAPAAPGQGPVKPDDSGASAWVIDVARAQSRDQPAAWSPETAKLAAN